MNIFLLDVGTGSMRGTLLDESAKELFRQQLYYQPSYGEKGIVEQEPQDWLSAAAALCRAAAAEAPVDAIGLTCQRSSVIPAAADGRALTRAIMWQDTRNQALCHALESKEALIRSISGIGLNTVCSGGKMAWLRRERPEVYAQAAHLFVIPDYLIYQMTGHCVTDHTYGSRSMLMELRSRTWSRELLELFGIDRAKLGTLISPSAIAGGLTNSFAAQCGLPAGTPVITCGGDQQCGAVGQGAFAPGSLSVNMGTGAYLIAPIRELPDVLRPGLTYSASAVPGEYILESGVLTCGAALDWFLKELGGDYAMVKDALVKSPPGARGVTALPYFQGRANPDWNSGAKAAFFGLSLGTTRLELLRALLEGICMEISQGLQTMAQLQSIDTIHLSGGLSKTPELGQLLADVTGCQVVLRDNRDATTTGAWMSALGCLELVNDWQEAWDRACPSQKTPLQPREAYRQLYRQRATQMERLYEATMK